jgi:pimeloyl-ACP methyl ester carboxylesterase
MAEQRDVSWPSLDGLVLRGTLVVPSEVTHPPAVLVHGGGVTREEGGFFTRMATSLAEAGVPSLRFDLRGHGESEGHIEDLTLAAALNDIRTSVALARQRLDTTTVHLLGASFGGGLSAYYAAKRPREISRLVLLNPQLDYKKRTIDNTPFWNEDHLLPDATEQLNTHGYLVFSERIRHGRAILNEAFWFRVDQSLGEIRAPTLLVHGTADTLVPITSTYANLHRFTAPHRLLEIEGAQHGFALHDDPRYLQPQSQRWQTQVIDEICEWLTERTT